MIWALWNNEFSCWKYASENGWTVVSNNSQRANGVQKCSVGNEQLKSVPENHSCHYTNIAASLSCRYKTRWILSLFFFNSDSAYLMLQLKSRLIGSVEVFTICIGLLLFNLHLWNIVLVTCYSSTGVPVEEVFCVHSPSASVFCVVHSEMVFHITFLLSQTSLFFIILYK